MGGLAPRIAYEDGYDLETTTRGTIMKRICLQEQAKLWTLLTIAGLISAVGCEAGSFTSSGNRMTRQQMESAANQENAASADSPIIHKKAPDFTLMDQNNQPVTLSQLAGKWVVLYFYPKSDTPGCTCEATDFSKLIKSLRNMNAEVYGISEDSVATHKVFIEKYNLGLNLLSDPNHEMMERYGAWVTARLGDETYGRMVRTTMIIDPEGIIRFHWPEVIPTGHAERVRDKVKQLHAEQNQASR
jgi:peroxiredoxin Q/BCP